MDKICFIATVPAAVRAFMSEYIRTSAKDRSVKIISNPEGAELLRHLDAEFIPLSIERKPSPWRDFLALIQLTIIFRHEHFGLIHSITPKAGMLSMLAGWMVGVPNRIHTFTGQVWVNKRGWKRRALKWFDKLIVIFSTHILVDSPSQRDFLVSERILPKGKGVVIGYGSICGVDTFRFQPNVETKDKVRAELGITLKQTVILFVGRLNRDKGILDLATAFAKIASHRSDVELVLVGAEEDVPFVQLQKICGAHRERLHRVRFSPNPELYMAAADIFCLPSYREGFGQVIIEAASSGVPTVASRIYGIIDAVEDGKTGLLYQAGNIDALTKELLKLIENSDLRQQMGKAALLRARELFSSPRITNEILALYNKLLNQC